MGGKAKCASDVCEAAENPIPAVSTIGGRHDAMQLVDHEDAQQAHHGDGHHEPECRTDNPTSPRPQRSSGGWEGAARGGCSRHHHDHEGRGEWGSADLALHPAARSNPIRKASAVGLGRTPANGGGTGRETDATAAALGIQPPRALDDHARLFSVSDHDVAPKNWMMLPVKSRLIRLMKSGRPLEAVDEACGCKVAGNSVRTTGRDNTLQGISILLKDVGAP